LVAVPPAAGAAVRRARARSRNHRFPAAALVVAAAADLAVEPAAAGWAAARPSAAVRQPAGPAASGPARAQWAAVPVAELPERVAFPRLAAVPVHQLAPPSHQAVRGRRRARSLVHASRRAPKRRAAAAAKAVHGRPVHERQAQRRAVGGSPLRGQRAAPRHAGAPEHVRADAAGHVQRAVQGAKASTPCAVRQARLLSRVTALFR